MAKSEPRCVLFLGIGNDPLGRAAELQFNAIAVRMGLPWQAQSRTLDVTAETAFEVERAARVVSLRREVHRPLIEAHLPSCVDKVEYWAVTEGEDPVPQLEPQLNHLIARILGGGSQPLTGTRTAPKPTPPKPAAKPLTAKVGRETAGRRGKGVTTVFDLPLTEDRLRELAAVLKQRCGTGGTVKDGRIEIQGDQRDRIVAELEQMGYKVKRAGG